MTTGQIVVTVIFGGVLGGGGLAFIVWCGYEAEKQTREARKALRGEEEA